MCLTFLFYNKITFLNLPPPMSVFVLSLLIYFSTVTDIIILVIVLGYIALLLFRLNFIVSCVYYL